MPETGKYIMIEGADGTGKTEQAKRLASRLEHEGFESRYIKEPGETRLGAQLRTLLLDPGTRISEPFAEALLMSADRAETRALVHELLANGVWTVSDRGFLSTFAYQGYGREMDLSRLEALTELVLDGERPDLLLLLDAPDEVRRSRRGSRGTTDRFEEEEAKFHARVELGYREMGIKFGATAVDASASKEEVEEQVWAEVARIL